MQHEGTKRLGMLWIGIGNVAVFWKWDRTTCSRGEKTASLWCPTGLGLQRRGSNPTDTRSDTDQKGSKGLTAQTVQATTNSANLTEPSVASVAAQCHLGSHHRSL